jgi:hypothetical protein
MWYFFYVYTVYLKQPKFKVTVLLITQHRLGYRADILLNSLIAIIIQIFRKVAILGTGIAISLKIRRGFMLVLNKESFLYL